jgi:hypothetical protein
LLLLWVTGCPPFDPDDAYFCEVDGDCREGERCSEDRCAACVPKICADFAGRCGRLADECGGTIECPCACTPKACADFTGCGTFDDGCGEMIECGCEAPETCGGAGQDGVCGCVARSCDELDLDCGLASDGCRGEIACGPCTWPEWCGGAGTDNICGRPAACISASAVCGYLGTIFCGDCEGGEMCGAQLPNQCGRPASCLAEGIECGFSSATRGLFCGGCGYGEMCESGACVASVRPFCWSDPEPIADLGFRWHARPSAELGELVLYADHPAEDAVGCRRAGSIALLDYSTISTASRSLLPATDFSALPLSGCGDNDQLECEGFVGTPRVRPGALELFISADYRCADWWDAEIYLSFRTSTVEPWSLPELVVGRYEVEPLDGVLYPVLLSDRRTLLYRDDLVLPNAIGVARRGSSIPGDASFLRLAGIPTPVRSPYPEAISCDGRFLLLYDELPDGDDRPTIVEIVSVEPLELGPPEPYQGAGGLGGFTESPDCGALYDATIDATFVRRRIACP